MKTPKRKHVAPANKRKQPSGSQNRKRAKERKAKLDALEGALDLPAEVLERIGSPPTDSTKVLPWVNGALVELTYLMLKQSGINVFERARHLREMAKALGMIYPRAEVEELLRRLLETLGTKKDKSGGTTPIPEGSWYRPVMPPDRHTDVPA